MAKDTTADPEAEAREAAVTPAPPAKLTGIDAAKAKARDAELARQAAQVEAVAEANATELPALGGALMEPGLGR